MRYQKKEEQPQRSLLFFYFGGLFSTVAISCLQVCVCSVAGDSQQHHSSFRQQLPSERHINAGERAAQEGTGGVHGKGHQASEGERMVVNGSLRS